MATTKSTKKSASASKKPSSIEVEFEFDRSTKGTHRFSEVAAEGHEVIGTLYVKKTAMGDEPWDGFTVTITPA